jgi:hypothetical protein
LVIRGDLHAAYNVTLVGTKKQAKAFLQRRADWGSSSLGAPCDEGRDGDGGHEGLHVSADPGCYSAPVLEPAEHMLDHVALAIDLPVVLDLDFVVGF